MSKYAVKALTFLSLCSALSFPACNAPPQSLTLAPSSSTHQTPVPVPSSTTPPAVDVSAMFTGDASFLPYVQKFVDDAAAQGKDVTPSMGNPKLSIQLGSLSAYGASVIGLCESGTNLKKVTFDPTFWNSVDDTQRELLAHHELGHCVLSRGHLTSTLTSGAYASIMYPIIMSDATYVNNYAYYQQELYSTYQQAAQLADPSAVTTYICNLTDLIQP